MNHHNCTLIFENVMTTYFGRKWNVGVQLFKGRYETQKYLAYIRNLLVKAIQTSLSLFVDINIIFTFGF